MPTEEMARKLERGRAARHDYEDAAAKKATARQEAHEIWEWVRERFPIEKQSQAQVSLSMLRWIHGKGNVTRAMVEARMRRQDERFEICDQSTSERGTA